MTHKNESTKERRENRGVALVTALLLLSLFTVMTLSMVIATTSDTLIDGYYRHARGSFYGADSGVNAVRQALLNDIYNNDLPAAYKPSSGAPGLLLPTNAFPSDITSGFGSYNSILGTSGSGSSTSWPATFELVTSGSNPSTLSMTPSPNNNALCNPGSTTAIAITIDCTYNYNYHIVSYGQSNSGEVNVVEEYGQIPFTVHMLATASPPVPLSSWSTLLDQYALCTGGAFVPGTMSGKMFSNQSWNFGDAGKYIFTGSVGAVNADVGYIYADGTCDQSGSTTDSHKGTTIDPTFGGGLNLGAKAVPLPTNSFNQETAVLDGLGDCAPAPATCSAPSNTTMAAQLVNAAGTNWSTSSTTGVFLPYNSTTHALDSNSSPGVGVANAGGLYVQGNVDQMTLTASTSGSGASLHKLQVIAIKQGTTTTTVTLDLTGNTTTISDSSGHTSGALTGLPQDLNAPAAEGCLIYVNGQISSNPTATAPTGLSGPSSGAAIQDGSAITVVSTGIISITGSLTYSTEPVSLNVSDTAVTPAPTNVLGIYTSGGNVQLQPPSNVATMEIDASIATINGTSGSTYGITAVWNNITNVNIVGGRVQNAALSGASVTARNIYFDQRFANGFSPPWFPATTVAGAITESASPVQPAANRTSWVNSSAQ